MSILVAVSMFLALPAMPGADAYLAGAAAEKQNDFIEAAEAYDVCADQAGPLAAYGRIRAAFCRAKTGVGDTALEEFADMLEDYAGEPHARMAQTLRAVVLAEQSRHAEAAAAFDQALGLDPKPWWMDRYEWLAAENLVALPERRGEGFAFFRQTIEENRFPGRRRDAASILAASSDPEDKLAAAFGFIRSRDYVKAGKMLAALAKDAFQDPQSLARRQLLWVEALLGRGQIDKGQTLLDDLAAGQFEASWAQLALLQSVRALLADDKRGEAARLCDRLAAEHPGAKATGDALWRLAKAFEHEDQPEDAVAQYKRVADVCPGHFLSDEALFRASVLQYDLDAFEQAVETLTRLRTDYPDSALNAAAWYWTARAREATDQSAAAAEAYRPAAEGSLGDFYVHRARAKLAAIGALKTVKTLDVVPGKPFLALAAGYAKPSPLPEVLSKDERIQRLGFFASHGLEEAEWEALALLHEEPSQFGVADLARALSEAGLAYTAMRRIENQTLPVSAADRFLIAYPRAYWRQVTESAEKANLDPYLLLAVGLNESVFRAVAESWAGARGVMQLMPATARGVAAANPSLAGANGIELDHPGVSLHLGAHYLREMLDRFGGNVVLALAAYNAGPGRVNRWLRQRSPGDLDAFIEFIPFSETRRYVKKVLGAYAAYRSLYPAATE